MKLKDHEMMKNESKQKTSTVTAARKKREINMMNFMIVVAKENKNTKEKEK